MVGKTTSARGEKYKYYRCSSQERRVDDDCKNKAIYLDDLDDLIVEELNTALFSPGRAEELANKLSKVYSERSAVIDQERTTLEKEKK